MVRKSRSGYDLVNKIDLKLGAGLTSEKDGLEGGQRKAGAGLCEDEKVLGHF